MGEELNMPLYISCDGGKTFQPFMDIQDMEISEEPEHWQGAEVFDGEITIPLAMTRQQTKKMWRMFRHGINCISRFVRRHKRHQKAERKRQKKERYTCPGLK